MVLNYLTNKFLLCFILFQCNFLLYPQIGGVNTFEFLNLNTSPRAIALGGYLQSVIDGDINNGIYNPAVINSSMNSMLVLNYTNYYADISYGNFGYSFSLLDYNFIASMKFINYGQFLETNEFGQEIGEFGAGEYLFSIGSSKSLLDSLLSVGINTKLAYSSFYELNSLGVLFDLGIIYTFRNQNLSTSMLIKNVGYQIVPYYNGNREPLPIEISLGVSNKLAHMPLRWHVTFQHIETPDLSFENPVFSSIETNYDNVGYNILKHITFGAELLLHKNVNFLFGYNNRTRFEMILEDRKGLVGFSCGVVFKIKRFHFTYSRTSHHLSGPLNSFGVSTNFKKID